LKHTFWACLTTGDFRRLDGLIRNRRTLATCGLFPPGKCFTVGRTDNTGGGVARLDIVVQVLDMVATVMEKMKQEA